jgi:hypothetical protein
MCFNLAWPPVPWCFKYVFHLLCPQAIFELTRGEQDLIEDLQLARKVRTLIQTLRECISGKQIKSDELEALL